MVHGTILQRWTSLMKNSASIVKKKLLPVTVEQLCKWMMKNSASDGSTITPATVEESCQWLPKIRASGYWTIVPSTAEQMCQRLLNSRDGCWTVVPAVFFLSSHSTFQRRINVVSTLWINVERTLIRRWKWNKIRRRIFNVAQRWYNVSARCWSNVAQRW